MTREPEDPLEELAREDEVAAQLVERLGEIGLGLRSGKFAAPAEIVEGLRLLGQYRTLHGARFTGRLDPEARQVALPTCLPHLDAVAREVTEAESRTAGVVAAVDAYARDPADGCEPLATALDEFTQAEYDELRHERDYPLSCLPAALSDDAAGRVRAAFAETAGALAEVERQIERYLARPPTTAGPDHAVATTPAPAADGAVRPCPCCDPISGDFA